jgi:hypothetical protein
MVVVSSPRYVGPALARDPDNSLVHARIKVPAESVFEEESVEVQEQPVAHCASTLMR